MADGKRVYTPRHFEQHDAQAIAALIHDHPLATLVTLTDGALTANHVPMLYDADRRVLRGHVARANPVWRDPSPAVQALAVFTGPDAYVTPSWYASKAEHGKVVPTWNYAVVHAWGPLETFDDPATLHELVSTLTQRHEAGRERPWAVGDAPPAYVEQMLRAIVGIRIPVQRLEAKWKLSQNRDAADRAGVAAGMGPALARLMPD